MNNFETNKKQIQLILENDSKENSTDLYKMLEGKNLTPEEINFIGIRLKEINKKYDEINKLYDELLKFKR